MGGMYHPHCLLIASCLVSESVTDNLVRLIFDSGR